MIEDARSSDEIEPGTRRQLRLLLPIAAVVLLWAYTWPSLRLVNVTWDEALGDLFFGQRYFSYFTTFDEAYLDFAADPYPEGHRPDLRASPFRVRPWEYYPFANTLAAASSSLFFGQLGLLDPLDGFHALNLLLLVFFVPWLFLFVEKRLGMLAAAASLAFLFGSPRVIGHLLANIKDFPLMVFFAITSMAFFRALERGSVRGVLAAGGLLGLTLATKANALFFPVLPLLLILFSGRPRGWTWGRLAATGAGAGAVTLITTFAAWPYLWADPIGRIGKHLDYLSTRKSAIAPQFEAPVLGAIVETTPPFFLLAFALGLVPLARGLRRRDPLAAFLLAWCLTPLVRYLLPQSTNFDGVRHFLELFPPMAILAGWGVGWLGERLRIWASEGTSESLRSLRGVTLKAALGALVALPGALAVLAVHPFHLTYWNFLVGGPAGAYRADRPQAGDYWGTSYRLGLEWLDEHAEPDSYLAVPVLEHAVRLVAPERLRQDIRLLPITTPFSPRIEPERLQKTIDLARQRPVYVMFVERRDWLNALMVDCLRRLEPEIVWQQDGAPVLSIYRYTPPPAEAPASAGDLSRREPIPPGG